MLVALVIYVRGWRHLPHDATRVAGGPKPPPLTRHDRRVVLMLILLSAIGVPATVAYYQGANAGLLFIEDSVARRMPGWDVPTSAFVALDGLFCFTLVPLVIALWKRQERRAREPGDMGKIAIGYLLTALGSLVMLAPSGWVDADPATKVSMIWPFLSALLNAVGFLHHWPTSLAVFSRTAPRGISATMMGVLFCSTFVGNVLVGTVGAGGTRCRMPTSSCCMSGWQPVRRSRCC